MGPLIIPSLELLHSPIQSMLHHVTHVHIRLPHRCIRHGQDGLDILQREAVPLHPLEGLRATDQCLHVLGIALQYRRAVLDDAVEIRNLFVACGSVGVGLHGQIRLTFATAFEAIETFRVVFDGHCVGGWCAFVVVDDGIWAERERER